MPNRAVATHRTLRLGWAMVVLTSFVIFNANFRELGLADTVPATLLPVSMLRHGDLTLDEFDGLLKKTSDGGISVKRQVEWTLAIQRINGELRSSYPVGAAVLAAPFYVLPTALGWFHTFDDFRFVAKIAASAMVALSAGFLFLTLRRWCGHRMAGFWALAYALGTSVCTIASQALWQHGPALLCLSVALWALVRLQEHGRQSDAALLSFAVALAVICRPQNALASAPLILFALIRQPRKWLALTAPSLLLGAWQISYNLRVFDNPLGGYVALYQSTAHSWRQLDAASSMSHPLLEGIANLLISPGKGLLIYSPVLFLGMLALPALAFTGRLNLAWPLLIWSIATLIFYAKNLLWWGGSAYGPRYLTEITLPLTVGLGAASPIWGHARTVRGLAIGLVSYGVLVQLLGLFTWQCGWHVTPVWLDFAPERVWNWRDPEVLRCARVLIEQGPKPPDLGPFAR